MRAKVVQIHTPWGVFGVGGFFWGKGGRGCTIFVKGFGAKSCAFEKAFWWWTDVCNYFGDVFLRTVFAVVGIFAGESGCGFDEVPDLVSCQLAFSLCDTGDGKQKVTRLAKSQMSAL